MLRVEDLRLDYGPVRVLRGISLRVRPGEIVALLGGNAAGKTTTLRALAGLARPRSGRILLAGRELAGLLPHERLKRGLAYCPAERQLFPEMSVLENLEMGSYIWGRRARRSFRVSLEPIYGLFPILAERARQRAGSLSGGEQKMLAIGRALLSRPQLLLLDEPSLGLAPVAARQLAQAIKVLNGQGLTIMLVEQNAPLALTIAHRAYLLERGRITLEGIDLLKEQEDAISR
ncbi:MAG TPA: ABC transporter ATP-binding protein [Candidatus Fraserbacteria bacterium]|nr:ABC transporter ATP-binding protein [Candidatus Fraserbacteria bacterium]